MRTPATARPVHRWNAALLTLLLTVLLVGAGTGSAQAADGYKYWNYFHVKGQKYTFAQTGPADFVPKDGSVEAYRYGLSSTADGLPPRASAGTYTVADICAGQEAGAGEKQVGVLIDYGTAEDAASGETPPEPRAACAVVPTAANGQQVVDAAADVRLDKQLLCGIDGYPVKTCSVTVKNPPAAASSPDVDFALPAAASASASPASGDTSADTSTASSDASSDDGGSGPWLLVGVVAAVVVLGAGGLALSRRSNRA